jgi:hypothetical protein
VDQPFTWDGFYGYTAFALGHPDQSEIEVRAFISAHMVNGLNTARVCSETGDWDGSLYWLVRKPRDPERLLWLLNIFATIPGAQVLLVGDCTLKRQVPLAEAAEWARTVAEVVKNSEFRNVAVETHNEPNNCRFRPDWGGSDAYCPGKQDIAEHIRIYRDAGIEFVTVDDGVCHTDFLNSTLEFRYANINAKPADFHPCRTRDDGSPWDPSLSQIRKLTNVNGPVLLSETVAWGDDGTCNGLRTCDQNRIQSYLDRCAQVEGCKFVFHSVNGLGGIIPGFIPRAE